MAHSCFVRQLNPHAVPYWKDQQSLFPLVYFPMPEPYPLPPSYILASYQSCTGIPVWVQPAARVYETAPYNETSKPKVKKVGKMKAPFCSRGNKKIKEVNEEGETSLMIKNIPNQLKRSDIISILDRHCAEENMKAGTYSEYDFLYLPMDFERHANLGYAFVNFTSEAAAQRFWAAFDGFKWEVSENKKICEINKAILQGKESFIKHFKNSVFPCHSNSYLPVTFSPPRDGLTQCKHTVVGKRVARAASH